MCSVNVETMGFSLSVAKGLRIIRELIRERWKKEDVLIRE